MKTNKFYIVLLLLSMIWNFSLAQNYTNYTEKDGLASNFVYRMTQDKEGFIWFLTNKGISKFDGKTFKSFTTKEGLPTNDNWNIRITPDNRVWYFSRSDELGFIKNDSVYKFKASNGKMMNPNGRIFQSGKDISFVDYWDSYLFSDSIWHSSKNQKNRIQLLNRDVFIVSDSTSRDVRLEDKQERLLLRLKKNSVYSTFYQFNDSLLARAFDTYFEIINLNSFKTVYGDISRFEINKDRKNFMRFKQANDMLQLSGRNWLITLDDQFDIKETFIIPEQLNSTYNFQDKDGFIWVATSTNGVYKLPIGYDSLLTLFEGKKIAKITEINDLIYIGVEEEGVYKLQNNYPELWVKEKIHLYNISTINEAICYNFRLHLILEKKGVFMRVASQTSSFVYGKNLLCYNDTYFAEGNSGIWRLNKNLGPERGYDNHPYYQGLFKQTDSLFSFSFKQMLFYDSEKDIFQGYKDEQIQQKFLTNTLYNSQNYIGTEGDGLYRFTEGKLKKIIQKDHAIINQISVENPKSIWAVSEGVLLHYAANDAGEFTLERYNQINGLPTNNLTKILFYKNQLYLGSITGLNIIDKKEIKGTSVFTPYIKSIQVNGKKTVGDSLVFKYDANLNFKINFGSINFFDANNTRFEYRLSPIQNSWTTTQSGEVNLFDLQPNDYTLQLQVSHNNAIKYKNITIKIIPKWWQTEMLTLVITLILILTMLSILFFVFRHFQIKLLRERKLAQLELSALRSQMNPHFVHNSLNAIQYYIQRHEVELSEDYLAKFSRLIRLFFEYSRRRTISIKDEIELLRHYLEVEKLRFEDKLEYEIIVDNKIDDEEQLIPSMILQPIVENAVNHGLFHKNEGGTILVKFDAVDASKFKVTIQDDGIGVNRAKEIYRTSTKNYQSRSSAVLEERLELLKLSKEWNVTYTI
ncbi:MAG: histidine kinase, partial [Altibacter sp.]|uniref:sensor histidine kinase n=1 Tax=Altibacter sp. TaxID=2024823 RepID=UPI001D301CF2